MKAWEITESGLYRCETCFWIVQHGCRVTAFRAEDGWPNEYYTWKDFTDKRDICARRDFERLM